MNGEALEFNKVEVGCTMKFTSQNHLFFYLEDHLALIPQQAFYKSNDYYFVL